MKKRTVLVIEDDPAVARLLSRFLIELGQRVTTASGRADAIRKFKPGQCGLIISDIELPDGNGIELAKFLRATKPTLRILLISGNHEAVSKAQGAGFRALRKPFDLNEVQRAIE